jgi:hypothetical protein
MKILLGLLIGAILGVGFGAFLVYQACSNPSHDCGVLVVGLYRYCPPLAVMGGFIGLIIGGICQFVGWLRKRK